MDKCVVWGLGCDYEKILNQLQFEIYKGNIEVVAVVSDVDFTFYCKKDGYKILSKDELINVEFDYLIIASVRFFNRIKQEAEEIGIADDKIINGSIFNFALFDWSRYVSLIKNPVTILSDDCWAGYIYHDLLLQFSTPCVNVSWPRESYLKFVQDPMYYLDKPLEMVKEGNVRGNQCPIGRIGEGEETIQIHFVHAINFKKAKEIWDRRTKRVNPKRIFVKFGLPANGAKCEEMLEKFDRIQFPKICFFSGETDIKNVTYLKRFEWFVQQGERAEVMIFSDYVRLKRDLLYRDIDILKLLNGEEGFLRSI